MDAYQPFIVAFNGKEAARRVGRRLGHSEPVLGRMTWQIGASGVFVLPSSSGSSADPKHFAPRTAKADWWKELGEWARSSGRLAA
jgi:hypothetical protein